MPTTSQTGLFEAGTFGYPIEVLLSSTLPAIKLIDIDAIELTLTQPDETEITRSLDPGDAQVISGDTDVSDTIKWIVLDGDQDAPGRYAFRLEIDSEGNTKHLVTSGTFLVRANASVTIGPETDNQLNGYLHTYDGAGTIKPNVTLVFTMTASASGTGESDSSAPRAVTSDTDGFLQANFRKGATYTGRRGTTGAEVSFTVPTSADVNGGFALPDILGK